MKFLTILLCIVLVSCKGGGSSSGDISTNNNPITTGQTNASIQVFVNSFQARYNQVVTLPVYFDTNNSTGVSNSLGTTVGVCRIYSNGYREVVVNKNWWDCASSLPNGTCIQSRSNSDKEILVYHELGHCVFNRDHDFELDSNGNKICLSSSGGFCNAYKYRLDSSNGNRPVSMMYPVVNPISDNYVSNNDYYHYELQNPKPQAWDSSTASAWTTAYSNYYASLTAHAMQDSSYNTYGVKASAMSDSTVIDEVPYDSDFDHNQEEPSHENGSCVEYIQ